MNKFVALFAVLLVMTMLFTVVAVPVLADGSPSAEESDEISEIVEDTKTPNDGWASLNTSDYIGIVVAVILLVAFVVAIVLFVPKKTKQR